MAVQNYKIIMNYELIIMNYFLYLCIYEDNFYRFR